MSVAVILNGSEYLVEKGSTVMELMQNRSIDPMQVVVELGGEILEREKFACTQFCGGEKIEILRFVGGG